MSKVLQGAALITVVEVVTMIGWLFFANRGNILGVIILTVGLLIEHQVALNVGAGRRPFSL